MGSATPVFYPDPEPAPTIPPVEKGTILSDPPKEEPPKKDEPPKEEPPKKDEPPKEEPPKKDEPPKEEPPKKDEPPATPETYELKAPDGTELDKAAVEAATPIFKELKLDNAQAQKLTDFYVGQMNTVAQTVQGETLRLLGMDGMAKWTDMLKADKELGGSAFEQNLTIVAAGRDQFATPELRAFFETSRIGNHPEMVRLFYKLGKLVQEGKFHGDTNPGTPKGGAESFYDPAFGPKA